MDNLKSKLRLLPILLLFIIYNGYAQEIKNSFILIIDNTLVTNGVELNFVNDEGSILFSDNYFVGKQLIFNRDIFNQNLYLTFKYIGEENNNYKTYNYKINILEGYFHDSSFLILRIFNLDKKEFKKVFCDTKLDYAVEIQNQVYTQSEGQCKKLKNKF